MSSNPGPALGGSTNPQTVSGGDAGTVVGKSATETVGFYGATGVALQAGVPVTAAGIHAALVALGLIKT